MITSDRGINIMWHGWIFAAAEAASRDSARPRQNGQSSLQDSVELILERLQRHDTCKIWEWQPSDKIFHSAQAFRWAGITVFIFVLQVDEVFIMQQNACLVVKWSILQCHRTYLLLPTMLWPHCPSHRYPSQIKQKVRQLCRDFMKNELIDESLREYLPDIGAKESPAQVALQQRM